MNTKILMVLIASLMLVPSVYALGGSQGSPVTVVVNYNISTNTQFTVTPVSGQTALNFTGNKNSLWVAPDGTGSTPTTVPPDGSVAWAVIVNNGEIAQTFKARVLVANPTGIQSYVSNATDMSGRITLATTGQSPTGWAGVAASGGTINLFARANFTNAAASSNNLEIATS